MIFLCKILFTFFQRGTAGEVAGVITQVGNLFGKKEKPPTG